MSKSGKSQWDFGELFPPEQLRQVLTVSQLTGRLRTLLEQNYSDVWVIGEVTNLRTQSSGHIYFAIKDPAAQLNCVLFRGEPRVDRELLQDGRKVIVRGLLTVYEARGQYQLRVTSVELQGIGALQAAFEKLKQKLKAEGMFDQGRKRPLPKYPCRLGLVTSPTGAAIRDVLHVVERRNPGLEIVLAPCRVQGEGAADEIAEAIGMLNELNARQRAPDVSGRADQPFLDLILVTRGGGSLEDLWAFNEEVVARAIYDSAVPIVSAVGHEIDFTIADFVADLRAATPSAAAEIITEGPFACCQYLSQVGERIGDLFRQQIDDKRDSVLQTTRRLARLHPRRRLEDWTQRVDELQYGLKRCARQAMRDRVVHWQNLFQRLSRVRPGVLLRQRQEVLRLATAQLRERTGSRWLALSQRLQSLEARLRLLGPEQVLARGYSITRDAATGEVLRSAQNARPGQLLETRLKDGVLTSRVQPPAPGL